MTWPRIEERVADGSKPTSEARLNRSSLHATEAGQYWKDGSFSLSISPMLRRQLGARSLNHRRRSQMHSRSRSYAWRVPQHTLHSTFTQNPYNRGYTVHLRRMRVGTIFEIKHPNWLLLSQTQFTGKKVGLECGHSDHCSRSDAERSSDMIGVKSRRVKARWVYTIVECVSAGCCLTTFYYKATIFQRIPRSAQPGDQ